MITYILLAHGFRYEKYVSMGALFMSAQAEDLQKTIDIRPCIFLIFSV
ncbi:MAG: hypothetical protein LBG92_00740 [Prevotellaceae bacterium]|nr:hypothetical protein [Prevotellaceae bacterium]